MVCAVCDVCGVCGVWCVCFVQCVLYVRVMESEGTAGMHEESERQREEGDGE